jgi:hypothetical protein
MIPQECAYILHVSCRALRRQYADGKEGQHAGFGGGLGTLLSVSVRAVWRISRYWETLPLTTETEAELCPLRPVSATWFFLPAFLFVESPCNPHNSPRFWRAKVLSPLRVLRLLRRGLNAPDASSEL